jgi:hypothetical protein
MGAYRILLIVAMGAAFFFSPSLTAFGIAEETGAADQKESFTRLQVPFIENHGQIENKEAAYFAKLVYGYIYIDKNGTVIHNYRMRDKKAIVFKEIFTEKKISIAALEPPAEEALLVLRKRGQLTGDNINYYRISYGAIDKGIDLQLLAFTDTLEKIFTISPGGDPGSIAVTLKGVEGVKVNDAGELEIITKQEPVKFGPPHAYQFVGETRKPVDVAYTIRKNATYGFKLGSYDKAQPLFIAPIIPAFLLSTP